MSGLLINNVLYGVGGGGDGECSGLPEITYAEYLANKAEYDASGKAYAIPDYPSNNNSAKVLGYSVIYNAQLTTNHQTFAAVDGRKFSDYDFVVVSMSNNGEEVRATTICPISIFQTGWPIYVDHLSAGGAAFNQYLVKYVDDTHVQANTTTSETVCKYLNIYGFKIVQNGNVYGKAPDLNALLDFISVGTTDLERVVVNTTNTYVTNHILYTASEDCIVNINGYVSYPKTSTTGFRVCNVSVDGVAIKSSVSPALQGDVTNICFDGIYKLKKGQKIDIVLLQTSGVNMEVTINKSVKVMNV